MDGVVDGWLDDLMEWWMDGRRHENIHFSSEFFFFIKNWGSVGCKLRQWFFICHMKLVNPRVLKLEETSVSYVNDFDSFAVTLDKHLNWKVHIDSSQST